jgi:hypothetical protein
MGEASSASVIEGFKLTIGWRSQTDRRPQLLCIREGGLVERQLSRTCPHAWDVEVARHRVVVFHMEPVLQVLACHVSSA